MSAPTTTGPATDAAPGHLERILRQTDYWITVYKRTWRASVFSSFVMPLFYVLAMGVLLGGFVDDGGAALEGAPSYLAFIAPGLVAAHAMQTATGETMYPVLGAIKWNKTYVGMVATPLTPADVVAAHLGFVLFRVATACGAFLVVLGLFGLFESVVGVVLAFFVQLLVGLAFATPLYGFSAGVKDPTPVRGDLPRPDHAAVPVLRRVLPGLQPARRDRVAGLGVPAVARRRPDPDAHARHRRRGARARPRRLPDPARGGRLVVGRAPADPEAGALMAVLTTALSGSGQHSRWSPSWRLVLRNYMAHRRSKVFFLTGFLEPVLYLFSIGIGVGQLIDSFEFNGRTVEYAAFVAPAMLAASAMNGAVLDSTFSIFFKLKFEKLYDAVLATPMTTRDVARGEITWALLRGGVYSVGFLVVMLLMGLVESWWALLAVPATLLIGFGFSAVCMALTTYMRSWQDFDLVTLAVMPLFLFSATFFPVTAYDGVLRWVVEASPLYRGVVLCRELTTGALSWDSAVSVVYLLVMGFAGLYVVSRRLDKLLLH